MPTFLSNREIYESVFCGIVTQKREWVWIAAVIAPILWRKGEWHSPNLQLRHLNAYG